MPEQVGGTVVRVIRAPGDALRLLSRDPKQAVAWVAALTLFGLALMAVRRRQLLGALTATPAFAFTNTRGPAGGPGGRGGGTALRERPTVAGAAPAVAENVAARVIVATASAELAAILSRKIVDSPHCELLATAGSVDALYAAIAADAPDVVVVDLGLPTGGEDELGRLLAAAHPPARTVGIAPPGRAAPDLVVPAYHAGMGGLLAAAEDLGNGQLAYAVRCVADGKLFYGPTVQVLLAEHVFSKTTAVRQVYLTERELELARLVAQGRRGHIARDLMLSEDTVKTHLRHARRKLGIDNPRDHRELRRRLEELGLLDDD